MLYSSMTTPLPTLSACSQRPYPRKYAILYSSTSPPQMAYIYLLSFPHRWRYRPFPFCLSLHSLTYITRQQTNMAASRVPTRPGMYAVQPSFWVEAIPKIHTVGLSIRRGRTLPYPNLWASADPVPWGSSGAIAHLQPWGSSGAIAHTLPRESRCTEVVAGSGRSMGPKTSKWTTDPQGPKTQKCATDPKWVQIWGCILHPQLFEFWARGNCPSTDQTCPVTTTLFRQCSISLNGVNITPASDLYPYRSYLESLLTYGSDAENSHLTNAYWYMDEGDVLAGNPTSYNIKNKGFVKRLDRQKQSKVIELYDRLHADVYNVSQFLLSGVRMQIRLTTAKEDFYIMNAYTNTKAKTKATFKFFSTLS